MNDNITIIDIPLSRYRRELSGLIRKIEKDYETHYRIMRNGIPFCFLVSPTWLEKVKDSCE